MKKSDDLSLIGDVLDAIQCVESYVRGINKETFTQNLMMQDAVMHQIEIIGEASNRISDEFREKHSNLHGWKCVPSVIRSFMIIAGSIYKLFRTLLRMIYLRLKNKPGNCWGNKSWTHRQIIFLNTMLLHEVSICNPPVPSILGKNA